MALHLLVRTKVGDVLSVTHNGDMQSFIKGLYAERAIIGDAGMWVPIDSISHVVPQITPQVPAEALQQVKPETETRQ